jgi:hypothetical protein
MAMTIRIAGTVQVNEHLILPWPDYGLRRFTVLNVGKRRIHGDEERLVFFQLRPHEGESVNTLWSILRREHEPMMVVTPTEQSVGSGQRLPTTVVGEPRPRGRQPRQRWKGPSILHCKKCDEDWPNPRRTGVPPSVCDTCSGRDLAQPEDSS